MLQNQIDNFHRALAGRQYPEPEILNCARFWVFDQKTENITKVEFSLNAQKYWLKVDNADKVEFAFVRIDGHDSVFKSSPPPVANDERFIYDNIGTKAGACDCLLIDTSIWHFTEFKTNSTSENLEQLQLNRLKAELQLARTITFFRENNVAIVGFVKAIVVVPTHYGYPRFKAANSRFIKFKLKWKVSLEEVILENGYKINA